MDLKEIDLEDVDWVQPAEDKKPQFGPCNCDNECSSSGKRQELLGQLTHYQLLKTDSASRKQSVSQIVN